MRVISGSAGGLPLLSPAPPVRPTMDRVREAIFSSLGEAVIGARVLDLFAGSGSLGIEALSRGAASATFVESDRRAKLVLEKNLARCGLQGEIVAADVFRFLEQRMGTTRWDIILADPPYAKRPGDEDWAMELCRSEHFAPLLNPGGFFVLETARSWRQNAAEKLGWHELWVRTYGESKIHLLQKET
jgi:16S rRNA (guanine966-N2)-methyltransferase